MKSNGILGANGLFPCVTRPYIKVFSSRLYDTIHNGKVVIANSGYSGPKCTTPTSAGHQIKIHSLVRERYETMNERLQNFSSLSHVFRHGLEGHNEVFYPVLNILQLLISSSDSLFEIKS